MDFGVATPSAARIDKAKKTRPAHKFRAFLLYTVKFVYIYKICRVAIVIISSSAACVSVRRERARAPEN